jgi:GNAT superfamily N-acetyltransferase
MITYREATQADLPSICALGEAVNALHYEWSPAIFAPPGAPARHLAYWQQSVGAAMATTFVAELETEIVGFASVTIVDETFSLMQPIRFARVGTVGVASVHQGKGIGHMLMACIERWAISKRAVENKGAIRLYEELGFGMRSHSFGKLLVESAS